MGDRTLTRRELVRRVSLGLCALGLPTAACSGDDSRPRREDASASEAAEGSVSQTEVMRDSRAAHTATALSDGGVLVAGGFAAGEEIPLRGTELYDSGAGGFVRAGDMTTPRQSHAAAPLTDGRVLIAGGYGADGVLRSAEVYDPSSKRLVATGNMGSPRAGHEAVALRDGRVLIVGGVGPGFEFLATAELYDPAAGRFSSTGSMSMVRESHTVTLLDDGRLLVTGGHAGAGEDLELYASAELYEPGLGRFVPTAGMTMRRHKHDAVRLADGRVLVMGGADAEEDPTPFADAEIYDPTRASFRGTDEMGLARYKFRGTSVLLEDGRVVVAGGASSPEVFEPATGRFSGLTGDYGRAPLFAAAARLAGGTVLVCGGYSRTDLPTGSAWLVRP